MNAIATTTSKLRLLSIVTCTVLAGLMAGCAADVVGTGDVRRIDSPNGPGPGDTGGSGTGELGGGPEVPAEIEALFAAPEDDTVTPDSILGVWASTGSSYANDRLAITKNSLTLARRCDADGRIAYVTVKIRTSSTRITVLESKSATLGSTPSSPYGSTCTFSVRLDTAEWRLCDSSGYDYDCLDVDGTKMTGVPLSGVSSLDEWVKLSD